MAFSFQFPVGMSNRSYWLTHYEAAATCLLSIPRGNVE